MQTTSSSKLSPNQPSQTLPIKIISNNLKNYSRFSSTSSFGYSQQTTLVDSEEKRRYHSEKFSRHRQNQNHLAPKNYSCNNFQPPSASVSSHQFPSHFQAAEDATRTSQFLPTPDFVQSQQTLETLEEDSIKLRNYRNSFLFNEFGERISFSEGSRHIHTQPLNLNSYFQQEYRKINTNPNNFPTYSSNQITNSQRSREIEVLDSVTLVSELEEAESRDQEMSKSISKSLRKSITKLSKTVSLDRSHSSHSESGAKSPSLMSQSENSSKSVSLQNLNKDINNNNNHNSKHNLKAISTHNITINEESAHVKSQNSPAVSHHNSHNTSHKTSKSSLTKTPSLIHKLKKNFSSKSTLSTGSVNELPRSRPLSESSQLVPDPPLMIFLKQRKCYDLIPTSSKLVVIDTLLDQGVEKNQKFQFSHQCS